MAESGVALISGAGSGIGRQLVLDLARRGWKIAGIARRTQPLEQLQAELAAEKRDFAWASADITNAAALAEQVRTLQDRLGPFDLLIASAGVAGETPAHSLDADAVAQIININLIGTSNTIAAVLPTMLARKTGHIVAISSLASYRGLPAQMAYSASKAGLNAMMESLWLDVKDHGLFVTTVCPGYIDTPQAVDMYKPEYLMPVEHASAEILSAIDRRKRFHAFPWTTAFQLGLLSWLPSWLQDHFVTRAINQAKKT